MNLDPKVSWWLNFLLFAMQSAAGLAWSQYLDAKTAAMLFLGLGYFSNLLSFAVHGTVPGIASQVTNTGKVVAGVRAAAAVAAVPRWPRDRRRHRLAGADQGSDRRALRRRNRVHTALLFRSLHRRRPQWRGAPMRTSSAAVSTAAYSPAA